LKHPRKERKSLLLSKCIVEARYMYKVFKGKHTKGYSLKRTNREMYHSIGTIVVLSGHERIHREVINEVKRNVQNLRRPMDS
jgi:hypothetical protein